MTFRSQADAAALAWKACTPCLPDDARKPGLYPDRPKPNPLCLPAEFADLNLLPDARDWGIGNFAAVGIPWHHGLGGHPGNHLVSSQVQCVNALAPMATNPEALVATFGGLLDIDEPLPFGDPADLDAFVAFEWVGLADHLNEHPGQPGTRGANNTSVDAAIRYRTSDGATEIALIEWKYTESYSGGPLHGGEAKNDVRRKRYLSMFNDPNSPVLADVLSFDDFLVEPIYQLLRQQLLAWQMERTGELAADVVRVVYAAPGHNDALWQSLTAAHRAAGSDLRSVWPALLARPDRFMLFDTAALVTEHAATSDEFKSRYGHLAVSPDTKVR